MLLKLKNVCQIKNKHKQVINLKLTRKNFSTSGEKEDLRYNYDFESPEKQEVDLKTIGYRFMKKFLIFSSIISFTYILLFRKYNNLAKRNQFYIINEKIELKISDQVSKFLKSKLANSIYKQDTEETNLILKIYKKILQENKINLCDKISIKNIYIIDSISFGAFLNKNGDLFISNRIIELAEGNEDEIALFIAVEIANILLGSFSNRVIKFFIYDYFLPDKDVTHMKTRNFFTHNMDKLNKYNRFLLFYPESVVSNYYEEVEVIHQAVKLLNRTGYNVFQAIEILRKFEEKIKFYPRHYKELLFVNRESRFYEGARNYVKIYLIDAGARSGIEAEEGAKK
jgi:hypothetical protein